jgi:hypothetical protein
MKLLKYKFPALIAITLYALVFISFVNLPRVEAKDLSYGINCKDGSSKLEISSNKSKDEATVKCKSGSKFGLTASGSSKSSVNASCRGDQAPATKGGDANGTLSHLTFYCVMLHIGGGDPTATPTHDPVSVKSTGSKEGVDPQPDDGDPSPIGAEYDSSDCSDGLEGSCKMIDLIVTITNAVTALAATVIVAMIVWGGIQYSMAGADASKVQAAKQKITNALIALLLLIFGFSIIQWLVPGGLI